MKSLLKPMILSCMILGGICAWADDVPVAPISSTPLAEWGEVYEISSKKVSLIVSPEVGAVVSMRQSGMGEHLLSPLRIQAMPRTFEEKPWESRAWRTSAGKQVVMLHRNMGEPFNLRVVHVIELSAAGDHYRQTTRITGLAPGAEEFLAPSIETTLRIPDEEKTSDPAGVQLAYGPTVTRWNFHWEIELPEDALDAEIQLKKVDDHLLLASLPGEALNLPPQGWTILSSLDIFWSTKTQIPPANDLEN